jgi:hypothetical protein
VIEGAVVEPFLSPGPGRVPVRVESASDRRISIGVPTGGPQASTFTITGYGYGINITPYHHVCDSPCTLYAAPGVLSLNTTANDLSYNTDIDVPPGGARVRMRTPSRWRIFGGLMMLSGGIALVTTAVAVGVLGEDLTHLDSHLNTVHDDPTPYRVAGGVLGAAGAGLFAGGLYLLITNRRGVAEQAPLGGTGRLRLDLAPSVARGGGLLTARLTF